jgi:hypothetical protein
MIGEYKFYADLLFSQIGQVINVNQTYAYRNRHLALTDKITSFISSELHPLGSSIVKDRSIFEIELIIILKLESYA